MDGGEQRCSCTVRLVQQRFGDLELEPLRGHSRATQDRTQPVHEAHVAELPNGDVDREVRQRKAVGLPRTELATGIVQHPLANRLDKPRLFGQLDELSWCACLASWTIPAQE